MSMNDLWASLSHGPPFLIAEVGQNHDGSLGQAHAFVDAIARSGAHAVKFQTHIAAAESTPNEPFRVAFSYCDASRFDYWRRMEFTPGQWGELKSHAEDRGLVFLSTPFSIEAIELLENLGMRAWKVASGEIGSTGMLDRMVATGNPLIVSTGMSGYDEIGAIVERLQAANTQFVLLQCTTGYPIEPASVGLNVLDEFSRRFGCPVGLSDHSGSIFPALAAAARGARVIEVHVTLGKDMFGPDISASLDIAELNQLSSGLGQIAEMLASPVDKDAVAEGLSGTRKLFGKSAMLRHSLAAGSRIGAGDVTFRKPGGGIAEVEFGSYVGRRLQHSLAEGHRLNSGDFEG